MWARIMAIYFMAMMLFTALSAIASNAQQQVYAIDVEAGKWYAFISPYNSIGVSAAHRDYGSIPVYRWDLNTSYFIFYAPAGGRVYILPSSVTNTVINTQSWFTQTVPVVFTITPVWIGYDSSNNVVVVGQGSPINITLNVPSSTLVFNGTHIIAVNQTNPVTLTFSSSSINIPIPSFSTATVRAEALIYVTCSYTIQSLSSISFNYQTIRACNATQCYDNAMIGLNSGGSTIYSIASASTTYSYNSTSITINISITRGSIVGGLTGSHFHSIVNPSLNVSNIMFAFPIPLQRVNGVITASNGNTIVLATPFTTTADVSVSRASLALLATQLNLSTNSTWILISLPAPSIPTDFINPVLVIDKPILGYYTVVNNVYYMFFKTDSPWSGTAYIAWNFPRSIASSVSFNPMYSDLMNYIVLINGTITLGSGFIIIDGSISFYYYSRVISISYSVGQLVFNNTVVIQVNDQTYIYTTPSALINANSVAFNTTVLDITPPAPITFDSPVYINYTVVSDATTLILPVEMLTSVYSTSGSWGYRIPVYITLGGSPMGLPVFRLELPLGQWIRQGLLSIGLEDLLIVDSENKPVYFYVSHWSSADTAVVYVRLNKPPTSSTITLYVLLYNRALWGTGITYSSIMTFDFVKPQLQFPVYGLYNTVTLRPIPQSITFYTTSVDYVTYYRNGTLVECHGSFCTSYAVQPIIGGQELVVRISNSTFSFFIDGQPAFSIDLASLTYYQNISLKTIQFIEYDTVEFATHYHSVPYTYSIGYLQGGLYIAPQLNQKETAVYNVRQESPWAMFMNILPLMIILVILGIVMKFISQPAGGTNQPMVNLP